ncbi:hypothetical protein [Ornithinimicrobium pekingense]|uniref:Uncharacterized protein n=1 Tax=Ornithinimicrobium pekingense TaxID=384677 RepID=A0ABQ2F4U7_9MICO|nr:hypothetical protein [Ornithinimicrobium pekingense]GGK61222.1 hypothetical protein GCM10011509_06900 [Ornithinimicrobium pekingense]
MSSEPAPRPGDTPTGLLLLGGSRREVDAWVAKHVAPLVVAPVKGWTLVAAVGSSSVGAPYDDAATVLAARPVPVKAGPALGFFEIDGRAVLTLHGTGRRRNPTWVVWEPDHGLLRPPGLELAGPAELVRTAGRPSSTRDELVDLLHETQARPVMMLQAVMATLELPGTRLLTDPLLARELPEAVLHEPDARQVGWFEDSVADSVRLRRELGVLE